MSLAFDPMAVNCPNCGSGVGQPCSWPPFIRPSSPPPLYHAERLDVGENVAASVAALDGKAADPEQWKAALDAAVNDLI